MEKFLANIRSTVSAFVVPIAGAVALGAVVFPAPANATSIDFNTLTPFGNQGNAFVINSDLTLSARTHIPGEAIP